MARSFLGVNIAVLGVLGVAVAGCEQSTAADPTAPVRFQLAAAASTRGVSAGVITSQGPLVVTAVQLVVGRAALGDGTEFGCLDCDGNFVDGQRTPTLVNLPAGGGVTDVVTEQVTAGRYGRAELSLEPTEAGMPLLRGAATGTTVRVSGTYNGAAFSIDLAIAGAFRGALVPPLSVVAGATPAAVALTLRLPVDTWFVANSRVLDPATAADRTLIEANIRASFDAAEIESGSRES